MLYAECVKRGEMTRQVAQCNESICLAATYYVANEQQTSLV